MAKDWTKIFKKYKGMWVALAEDEETVVSSGATLREALSLAQSKGVDNPIMTRMPDTLSAYVGVL